jgi:hypothetical protein
LTLAMLTAIMAMAETYVAIRDRLLTIVASIRIAVHATGC